jgi:NTP pyrophosphatase (non-canonical NTP hydrolase)
MAKVKQNQELAEMQDEAADVLRWILPEESTS